MKSRLLFSFRKAVKTTIYFLFVCLISIQAQAQHLKILPLGNSMTAGWPDKHSYRIALTTLLNNGGFDYEFVGRQVAYDVAHDDPSTKHEGHSGYTAVQISEQLNGWLTTLQSQSKIPDYVLLHAGTNDVKNNIALQTSMNAVTQIIATLETYNPNVVIFLAKIIPSGSSAIPNAGIVTFNTKLVELANSLNAAGHLIVLVDQYSAFLNNGSINLNYYNDLDIDETNKISPEPDYYHPDNDGDLVMAQTWFNAIQAYTIGTPSPSLTVSPATITIGSFSGSTGTFNITSNTSWNVTDNASWLSVSPASGSNNGTVTVTATSANTGASARTATITVSGTGVSGKTVTVTQDGSSTANGTLGYTDVYSLTAAVTDRRAMPVTFTEAGDIQSITIYHNGSTGNMLLAVYSDASGLPSSKLGVTASTLVNASAGWQTVPLSSPVHVNAGQTVWLTWLFQNSTVIRYTTGTPGRARSSGTWSGGMPADFGTCNITAYKYSIYCTYSTGTPSNTLAVSPATIAIGSTSGSTGTFDITSDTSWTISDNASWLSVSPASGSNNGTVTVTATSDNTGASQRTATVTVSGTGVSDKTVTVTQDGSSTANGTLGYTDVYSLTAAVTDRRAMPVTFTQDGDIQSITIYHNGSTGNMLLGVYSDASGLPSSKLGVTASTVVNASAGWQTVPLSSPVHVNAGQTVWLTWLFQNSTVIRYTTGTPGRARSSATWSGGMPSDFGTCNITAYKYSIYCTYSTGTPSNTLSVSPSTLAIGSTSGSTGTSDITSDTSWTISDDASWLSVSPASGSNNGTVTVTATSDNTGASARTATVTVSGTGVSDKTVTVTQDGSSTANSTLGYTDVYSLTATVSDRRAMPVTFPEDGDIQSITIYHNGSTGNMLLGVYSDASGRPSSNLGVTASTALNASQGWQTVPLSSPVPVNAGQTVWLAWVFQNSTVIRYTSGTPGRARSSAVWSGGMPSDFGTCNITNYRYSIYCTYTPVTVKSAEISAPLVAINAAEQFETGNLKVYPNPFTDYVRFEFNSPEPVQAQIDIYDMTGRKVATIFERFIEGGVTYNAEFKPDRNTSAMYIYQMTMGDEILHGKIIYKKE